MRDLQLGLKRREPQRHNEGIITDLLCRLYGDGDLVADTLLLGAVRRGDQYYLGGLVADRVLEDAFPIIAAAQTQDVGEYIISERGQLRAEPQSEGVILRTGVTDEQRLACCVTPSG